MAWVEVKSFWKKKEYDITVGKWQIYVPKHSKMMSDLENAGYRFNIYVDKDNSKAMIVPIREGSYKFIRAGVGYSIRSNTRAGRVLVELFPIGRYVSKKTTFQGHVAYVFDRNSVVRSVLDE